MIKYLKQYADKTFEELVNSLIWFDNPLKLKAIFAKLHTALLADAPIDGKLYGRQDEEWTEIINGGGDSRPYKVYTALLTQLGTDAPVATILENTLGDIVWSYDGVGIYSGALLGAFSINKTHLILTNNTYTLAGYPSYNSFDVKDIDSIRIVTTESPENINGNLYNTPIEIRVYN